MTIKPTIKWNADRFGVEIQTEDQYFVLSAKPSMVMDWHDAVRFLEAYEVWQLPTREQLKLVAEHISEVDALIKANGGYKLFGWHWTADEHDEFCAWYVNLRNGYTRNYTKGNYYCVRAVSAL